MVACRKGHGDSTPMAPYEVVVLRQGYSRDVNGTYKANCTITLVKGPHIIIVDTGTAWDSKLVADALSSHGLSTDNIEYVVVTHGHSDHAGNLNMFTKATHIVGYDINRDDTYIRHDFKEGIPYEIDDYVEVRATPGHTAQDVSVLVKGTAEGVVAIVGDLFECFEDLDCPEIWQANSIDPELQQSHRIRILKKADVIIPGHGPKYTIPASLKNNLCVVMAGDDAPMTREEERATACEEASAPLA